MKTSSLIVLAVLFGIGFKPVPAFSAAMSLDQAAKQVSAAKGSRVLSAKTETSAGKQVHVIKSLTADGRIQHHRFDVQTGKLLNK